MLMSLSGADAFGRLRRALAPGHAVRSVAVLAGGALLGQMAVVLASPALSRLFSPEDFGVLAVIVAIITVLSLVSALRFEFPILIAEDEERATSLLALSLAAVAASSVLALGVVWLLGDTIVRVMHAPGYRPYLWFIPAMLCGSGLAMTLTYWCTRKRAYAAIARSKLGQNVIMVAVQIGAGLAGLGAAGLLSGVVAGSGAACAPLARPDWHRDWRALRRVRLRHVLDVARRYRTFPLLGTPAVLLNNLGLALPTLLLAALYDARVVGWYAFAQRVAGRPIEFVATSVTQVFDREAAEAIASHPERLPRIMARAMLATAAFAVPYTAVLAVFGPWLFTRIFGPDWTQSGEYMRLLALGFITQTSISPIGDTLEILQRQDLYIVREVLRIGLLGGMVALVLTAGLGPSAAIVLLAAATALAYLIFLGITLYAVQQRRTALARVTPS